MTRPLMIAAAVTIVLDYFLGQAIFGSASIGYYFLASAIVGVIVVVAI